MCGQELPKVWRNILGKDIQRLRWYNLVWQTGETYIWSWDNLVQTSAINCDPKLFSNYVIMKQSTCWLKYFWKRTIFSPISRICGAGIFEGQAQGWIASKLELCEEWSSRSRPEMFVEETTGDWFWGLCWQAGSTWQWQAGWHLTMQPLPFDICPHSMTYIPNARKFYLSKLQRRFSHPWPFHPWPKLLWPPMSG